MATVYWYQSKSKENYGWWELVESGSYAEDGEWWPTHWMPLPEPPKEE
jgi:hypothetical protein